MKHTLTLLPALFSTVCLALFLGASSACALTWAPAPGWRIQEDVLCSDNSSNEWSVIESAESASDGCISGKIRIGLSTPMSDPVGPKACVFWGNDVATASFEKRYEASVLFRRTAGGCYRVGFSARDQEISLWRTDGGFLAVKTFPIKLNEELPFTIEFSGARLRVSAGGAEVIDFLDVRPSLSAGRVGLATFKGTAAFSGLSLGKSSLDEARGVPPVAFSHRKWHGQDWFFNGLEPIACLDNRLFLNCKLGACYRMIGSTPAFWLQWLANDQGFANKEMKLN